MPNSAAVRIGAFSVILAVALAGFGSAAPVRRSVVKTQVVATGPILLSESFTGSASTPSLWSSFGGACLTAGGATTPSTSIAACGKAAVVDPVGGGALQVTNDGISQFGAVVANKPLSTAAGFQVVFTDATFAKINGDGDGLAMFLADASQPFPKPTTPKYGGYLGYVGVAGGYVGVGFDEYGNYSSSDGNGTAANGFPGRIQETVAVRGAYSTSNQYLGGYTGTSGTPQSLPFMLDSPTVTVRPAQPPTMRVTLTPASALTVEIDPHDGNGYRTVYAATIAGLNGQPTLPANVYLGFAASTGWAAQYHQIENLTVTQLTGAAPTPVPTVAPTPVPTPVPPPVPPTPTPVPVGGFTPKQIANLAAWYDASDATTIAQTAGNVSSWLDKSGNGNTLVQATTASMPATGQTIDGLGALAFKGAQYLSSTNASFSHYVQNESTAFVVTNATTTNLGESVMSSGIPPFGSDPRWEFRPWETAQTHFDFNNVNAGRIASTPAYTGPTFWSMGGSVSTKAEFLSRDGTVLGTNSGPGTTESAAYPLVVGGNFSTTNTLGYPYLGTVGEILVFNRYLSTTETQEIEGYLACKWGLQSQLPASHPYKSVCPGVATPAPTPPPSPLPTPLQLFSANGKLTLTVVASQGASGNPQLTYNGSPVPPTLRLLPGDTLYITLTNSLPTMPAGSAYLNDTNLHFHGLHVSPNAPADDSIDMLALPGQTLNYVIPIPANHPTGLYWYHSHAHGEVERQNLSGMSGALVIDGISTYVPSVANLPEQILIVRDAPLAGQALPAADRKQIYAMGWAMQHGKRGANLGGAYGTMTMGSSVAVRTSDSRTSRNPYVTINPRYKRTAGMHALSASDGHCVGTEAPAKNWTVNGATVPAIGIKPGQQQFWRLVNAGSDTYLDVQVDNAQMQVVALDGVPLSSGINTPTSLTVNDYVVPPASRLEFIVTGPPAGTTSYLRTLCFDAGAAGPAMPATVLAVLNPSTSPTQTTQIQRAPRKIVPQYRFPNRATRVASAASARGSSIGGGLRPSFTTVPATRSQTLYYSDQNTINGQTYDPSGPPQFYAQSGTVEEWTIINTSSQVHTFHIHQIHFALEAINGVSQPQEYVMDNVNVPAASASGPGSVKILLDFTDPTIIGTFLLHCHILSHEDAGMMAKINVGTSAPLAVSSSTVSFAAPTAAAQKVTVSGGTAPYSISGCGSIATGTISGSTITISPGSAGSCAFTVADATGLSVTISVNVAAAAATMTVSPNTLSFATSSTPSQNATVAGGTPPYAVSGCTGTATAAINATQNGVTVAPLAPGSCTLTIADSASNSVTLAVTVNSASSAGVGDNDTFHHDAGRTGWYSAEPTLTTTNVASASFKLQETLVAPSGMPAMGKVYAQPLYVQGETASDGKAHNLVIIATSTDQVYAFDETTKSVVWEHNFTNPSAGITQQLWTDTGCGDINPNIGITGTPVIDRSLDRLFVVVPTKENGVFHLRLHALALGSGADVVSPVEVTATVALASGGTASTSAEYNNPRGALLEANGNIYVPLSSHCDYNGGNTHGWILAYANTTLAMTGNAVDTTNAAGKDQYLGTIWMSGFGPAADSSGNIYFTTGNGVYDGTSSFAMSALKLPGNLDISKASVFTPYGELADSNADADLGSGGVVVLPTLSGAYPRALILGGKCGAGSANGGTQGCQKYILNRDSMGGFHSGDSGALWQSNIAGGMWGGPATFQDANGTNYVVYGSGSPLSTYTLSVNPLGLTVQSSGYVGCLECRDTGSQPIVSSNGTTPGTAVAWAIKTASGSGGNLTLYAFDALNMSHVLFTGVGGPWTVAPGASYIGGALISPTVANGHVYLPFDGGVAVFGVAP